MRSALEMERESNPPPDPRTCLIIAGLEAAGIVPRGEVGMNTSLVSSGLVDSFELVSILGVLEGVTGLRIPVGRVGPQDLDTVESMLRAADRWGQPI